MLLSHNGYACLGHANIVGIILRINLVDRWMHASLNRAM